MYVWSSKGGLDRQRLQRSHAVQAAIHVSTYSGGVSADGKKFGIVIARFNSLVTNLLLQGALETFERHGSTDIDVRRFLTAMQHIDLFFIP